MVPVEVARILVVVVKVNVHILQQTIRDALAELLPGYMVPQHYVLLDRLPLSGNGKVDLTAAPKPWAEPAAEPVGPAAGLQEQLFEIWRETLARNDFGVTDNFFELGGDSLHAVATIGRIREDLGLALSAEQGLQLLFDSPTIAELALALARRTGS